MASSERLITILADGKFHSGTEIGEVLGVSRTAVWQSIKKLEQFGLSCDSVKGKGYRIAGGIDLLERQRLLDAAGAQAVLVSELEIFNDIDSTNRRALAVMSQQHQSGYVCLAEHQSAGRGRRGKQWVSPYGANIYLSLGWVFSGGVAALEGLSLAVGVVVAQVLEEYQCEAKLKWPNDILHQGNKLGGILLEMSGDATGPCEVVVGVGLNVGMPQQLSQAIDQPWTDLRRATPQPINRSELAGRLVAALLQLLSEFEEQGFAAWREAWNQLDYYRQKPVCLLLGEQRIEGLACGVDASGALQLQVGDELRSYRGGEISMRPL